MFFSQTRKNTLLLSTRLIQSMSSPTRCFEDVLKNLGILSRRCDWILGALGIPPVVLWCGDVSQQKTPTIHGSAHHKGLIAMNATRPMRMTFGALASLSRWERMNEAKREVIVRNERSTWHDMGGLIHDKNFHYFWPARSSKMTRTFSTLGVCLQPVSWRGSCGVCWQIKDLPETLNFTFTMVCSISRIYMMILNWFVVVCNNPTGCNLICTSIVVSQLS